MDWHTGAPSYDHHFSACLQVGAAADGNPDGFIRDQAGTDSSVPDESAPDKSAPDESAPDESAPDESAPDKSAPEHVRPLAVKQVHATGIVCLTTQAAVAGHNPAVEADAMVCTLPGVPLAVKTADCCPLLLGTNEAVAAVHAGWRGAAAGVVEKAVAMLRRLSSSEITAHLGPAISQAAYQVDDRFITQLCTQTRESGPSGKSDWCWRFLDKGFAPDPERYHFDLRGYIAFRLLFAGVNRLDISRECTFQLSDRYASYRRAVLTGGDRKLRQWSLIMLKRLF